jgi:hypothetical protein
MNIIARHEKHNPPTDMTSIVVIRSAFRNGTLYGPPGIVFLSGRSVVQFVAAMMRRIRISIVTSRVHIARRGLSFLTVCAAAGGLHIELFRAAARADDGWRTRKAADICAALHRRWRPSMSPTSFH